MLASPDRPRSKNYLTEDAIDPLKRRVVIFLEMAELRAKSRQETRMNFWKQSVDRIITSNGFLLLTHAGSISHERMEQRTADLYHEFDQHRKKREALEADPPASPPSSRKPASSSNPSATPSKNGISRTKTSKTQVFEVGTSAGNAITLLLMKKVQLEFTRYGETATCDIHYKTNARPEECAWSGQFQYYQGIHGEYDFREFPMGVAFNDLKHLAKMAAAFAKGDVTVKDLGGNFLQ